MDNESAKQRPQDKRYEEAMYCEKSDTKQHYFVLRVDRNGVQRLRCKHCWTLYDNAIHKTPEGYEPS
jgi:hypothetical protein